MSETTPETRKLLVNRLAEIEARADQATPGSWYCCDRGDGSGSVYPGTEADHDSDAALIDDGRCPYIRGEVRYEDGVFAAHARTDIPFLIAHLRDAARLLEETKASLQERQRIVERLAVIAADAQDATTNAERLLEETRALRELVLSWQVVQHDLDHVDAMKHGAEFDTWAARSADLLSQMRVWKPAPLDAVPSLEGKTTDEKDT